MKLLNNISSSHFTFFVLQYPFYIKVLQMAKVLPLTNLFNLP